MAKKSACVDKRRCVACGVCTVVCPRNAIAIHKGCYALAESVNCIGCGKCEKVCPAGCIAIKEREQNE